MRKLLQILIPIIFVSIIIGGIYFSSLRKEETTFEPEYVTFPFSWEEDDEGYLTKITGSSGIVRITIANITSFGKTLEKTGLSWKAEEGYQYFGVYAIGKNLLNEEW